jgi:hypothetical protein
VYNSIDESPKIFGQRVVIGERNRCGESGMTRSVRADRFCRYLVLRTLLFLAISPLSITSAAPPAKTLVMGYPERSKLLID